MSTDKKVADVQLPYWLDLNRNGLEDYREGWFVRTLWLAMLALGSLLPQHTIAAKAIKEAEKVRGVIFDLQKGGAR